jgi:hypothetical protein
MLCALQRGLLAAIEMLIRKVKGKVIFPETSNVKLQA